MNNMKKNVEKILASASIVIALVLIVILLVTAFGGIEQKEFDNSLVKGLFVTLAVLYMLLAGGALAMLFIGSEAVREITLRSEQGGNCKATLGVIRKLVKQSFASVEGVKTGKVGLIVNEYGVKLKVSVRIVDRDVFETETYLRTLLEEVFKGALGFRFHAIEFKIVSLQARFKPDKDKVDAAVAEKVAAHTANYAVVPNLVEHTAAEDTEDGVAETAEEIPAAEESAAVTESAAAESTAAEETAAEESAAEPAENESEAEASDDAPEELKEYDEEENITEEGAEADADAENEQ